MKPPSQSDCAFYTQSLSGCASVAIGETGLNNEILSPYLSRADAEMARLRDEYHSRSLPLLKISEETTDIAEAEAALACLSEGARTIVFFGTGGSALGGMTLAQIGGWNIPGGAKVYQRSHPRTRFYDNLDPLTMDGALEGTDLASMRFVVTSKSGGTTETLAQLITTMSLVKEAGLGARIPSMFLGVTEPGRPGKPNGLRDLLAAHGVPMLDHHTSIGGRFSCLTNVGLLPALARGLDARAIRAGAASVINGLLTAKSAADFAPALGAASMIALSKERGVRTLVMMPYADRLAKFAEWYVQLWAESLGKKGEGTTPVPALGPVDQHSQLQLFMDGPREIAVTLVRVASKGTGPTIDPGLAKMAGVSFMGGKTIGDVLDAQAHAIEEALVKAGRPVRTFDLDILDERTAGALLMHFMLETILAGRLLGIDPFDQPAVELAKALTKERLAK
jgi:glucose-6-phosphate isomerase